MRALDLSTSISEELMFFFLLLCKQKKKAFILFLDTQIIREMQSQMHYMIYNHFKLPLYIWLIVALLLPS